MLGNDVVDLLLAKTQSNWKRKNYLDKVFTYSEQQEILKAKDPDLMVWLLWSMKEAAYKIVNRLTLQRFYNPKGFVCKVSKHSGDALNGWVYYHGKKFYTISNIHNDFVHTIAFARKLPFKDIKLYFSLNQPNYVERFNESHPDLHLQKNKQGMPELLDLSCNTKYLASISHHGKHLCIVHL